MVWVVRFLFSHTPFISLAGVTFRADPLVDLSIQRHIVCDGGAEVGELVHHLQLEEVDGDRHRQHDAKV